MTARASIDWDAMEPEWRAGIIPVLQLSKTYGVSRAAIIKHWEKLKIGRDLSAKINQRAEELVTQAVVTQSVTLETRIAETTTVEVNATMIANKIMEQRSDLTRVRQFVHALFEEVREQSEQRFLLQRLAEMMDDPEAGTDKLSEVMRKVISLPSRVDTTKKLVEMIKVLIDKEREVFNIGQTSGDDQISALKALFRESAQ